MRVPPALLALSALSLLWTCLPGVLAQTPPRLDSASVTWLQRGTTQEITLKGDALEGIAQVLVQGGGVSARPGAPKASAVALEGSAGGLSSGAANSQQALTLHWVSTPDAALGPREVRVAGPHGVSNPLTLQLSDLQELPDPRTNVTLAKAAPLMLPVAVSGVLSTNTESDFFRFKAGAGKALIFDLHANRDGSPLDANLILRDTAGKELVRSEDAHGLDPFIEYTPVTDGDLVVEIHDLRYQGGSDYRYRLVAGHLPYLESLFPFGGRRGSSVELKWIGRNLEGVETLPLQIAPMAPLGRQEVRARTPLGHSNPLPFEVGDLEETADTEPNDTPEQAQSLGLPRVVHGRIGSEKDVDVFRFKAPADQRWIIEVQARAFGSRLDALLTLSDTNGAVLQRNDDAAGPDARIEFDAKKDAEYRLTVRDLTQRGGDRFGYRMILQPADRTPDFGVRIGGGRFRVAQGGSVAVRCDVDRRNGFDGLVRIEPSGLPPGVWAAPLVLGPGASIGWWVISANSDAALGYVPLKATALGDHQGKAMTRPVAFAEMAWLTVLPGVPFDLSVAPASLLAEQNSAATLEVRVQRRDGFDGEVRLVAEDLAGVSIPAVTVPPGQARARLALQVAQNAETGIRPLMIRAEATAKGRSVVTHAPTSVPFTVQPIPLFLTAMLPGSPFFRTDPVRLSAVALPEGTSSEANQTEFVVKVDRRGAVGEIDLRLEDLPQGVEATVSPIRTNKTEATIRLKATSKAQTGKEHTFRVAASSTHQDRIWRQKTQPVHLTLTAPETESTKTDSAKTDAKKPEPSKAPAKPPDSKPSTPSAKP
jgi:hypothetical protein